MDYINYVKQSPMSMSGLGGPVGALNFHSGGSTTWYGDRGFFAGGNPITNQIGYRAISSTGNFTDFGDLTINTRAPAGVGGEGRAVFAGGQDGPDSDSDQTNVIGYLTASSTGNATDFGDLTIPRKLWNQSCSDGSRGVFMGGDSPGPDTTDDYDRNMDYITIKTTGNATDFGDLGTNYNDGRNQAAGTNDATRGVIAGGSRPGHTTTDTMEYITIASAGNATQTGALSERRRGLAACSNDSRGVFMGGWKSPGGGGDKDTMDYITIQSMGVANDFGNLSAISVYNNGTSNGILDRGLCGAVGEYPSNVVEYITISSTGNSTDFGDLTYSSDSIGACSQPPA